MSAWKMDTEAVCDTAKVRFFKQITTGTTALGYAQELFVILQKYDFSSKSQPICYPLVTILLFVILQKYDFSSKSQQPAQYDIVRQSCL